ncbi:TetR/AcrR family transcriptional regulator [Jeotgalibacillus soli]|uniref:TetR family transcriptional regulator n=1 Tax=Jeotgalibacillus soli TaxID=889306 RepID=A0A0C2VSN9_9BACL|nr:TetR/AcrR family transcriptional regulator [Jeotgalibacillus soli]KIL51937.1 TetR family transcriptional regulator [Jeotgalibacillus soli]
MMKEKQTREKILSAAKELFSKKGFEHVTVREIARAANCSHTSIYVYFTDKRQLLEELASGPLNTLMDTMNSILQEEALTDEEKLVRISQTFVHFGLIHRNLYEAYMAYEGTRVDLDTTAWELNKTRLQLFEFLMKVVSDVFNTWNEKEILAFSRMIYYQLHGIIMTYKDSEEGILQIERRVLPIVKQSIQYLVKGAR